MMLRRFAAGAATTIAVIAAMVAAPAGAAFGPDQATFVATPSSTSAAARDDFRVAFEMNTNAAGHADGFVRRLETTLPPGMIGDPTVATTCPLVKVKTPQNGACERSAAVGSADLVIDFDPDKPAPNPTRYTRPIYRIPAAPDAAASFAFQPLTTVTVRLDAVVSPSGGYRLRVVGDGLSEGYPLLSAALTLWGVPADHRGPDPSQPPDGYDDASKPVGVASEIQANNKFRTFDGPDAGPRLAFMSNRTRCDIDDSTRLLMWSWPQNGPSLQAEVMTPYPRMTDCAGVPFAPTIDVRPTATGAGKPAGYVVGIRLPQSDDPSARATAHLKDVTVTLPEGTAISPPVAHGLEACSDAAFALHEDTAVQCPAASKIGSIKIATPVLDSDDPANPTADGIIKGEVYVAEQRSNDPASGDMYRMFVTAKAPGVLVKLAGKISANPSTGQLTTTFTDNPELPFSALELTLDGGDRAALVNPMTCGEKTAAAKLASWAGQVKDVSSTFTIDQDCPTGAFAPTFEAGTTSAMAGAFAPFTMTIRRNDGDQDLSQIGLDLPPGLLGALGSVPLCGEAQAAAGTCDESTRVGSTTVSAGTGGAPYSLPGKVYLAGPYKGAPFSMSIVVPAKAGPFDLGLVVVRSPLQVDANKAKVAAPADPLPRIVGGVPLHLRMVNIALDRAGFIFNATSCQPMAIGATLQSTAGATVAASSPYQAQGCDKVILDPKLSLKITGGKGEMGKFKHPGVEADLSQAFGQSGLKKVRVKLPVSLALDTAASNKPGALCEPAGAAARNCPDSSIVGHAVAETPALHEPLKGPIYFVRGERIENGQVRKTLPGLYIKLEGEGVPLDLHATSSFTATKPQLLEATFDDIPDAPIKSFRMTVNSGKGGILQSAKGVCVQPKVATVTYEGHTGGSRVRQLEVPAPDCGLQIASASATQRMVTLRVTGIGAGRLELTGSRLSKSTRTVNKADTASIKAIMTRSTRRSLAQGKTVKVALAVKFRPTKGKAVTLKKTITVKGKKAKAKKKR